MIGFGQSGFNWNRASILASAPTQSGVYAIYNASAFIYIGEGQDIRARLLDHLNGDNSCVIRQTPTGFVFETVSATQRVARQDVLILSLTPLCNRKLG